MFAVPTYAFLVSMFAMSGVGIYHALAGGLHHSSLPADHVQVGAAGSVGIFLLLHAFASGGAATTGVEAISNGVHAFKAPEWKNARSTLMVMGACLGVMFIGISWLAMQMHVIPSDKKTVISQIATGVFGSGTLGHVLFLVVQGTTMLILVLAANTSFADFPRLASFHADDHFMPKQLTKRGHRLVFSNGIVLLSVTAAGLVVLFQADVTHLIPLYAIGVFTSFTLSQAGMSVRHLRLREPGWRIGLAINGTDELRAVHIAADPEAAEALMEEWQTLPLSRFPPEIVECPDRRIARAALEVVAEEVADGRTEVTVLLPRREYQEFWHRFLHDRTSDSIARALGALPHANVTVVPYHLTSPSNSPNLVPPVSEVSPH